MTALAVSLALSIIFMAYLGDPIDKLSNGHHLSGAFDYAGLTLTFLMLIIFAIIFILREKWSIFNGSKTLFVSSYVEPASFRLTEWSPLPVEFLNITNPVAKVITDSSDQRICFRYNTSMLPFPEIKKDSPGCLDGPCKVRIALGLFDGAYFTLLDSDSNSKLLASGSTKVKDTFMPSCGNSLTDFEFGYGNERHFIELGNMSD